jgi:hypothetical protein
LLKSDCEEGRPNWTYAEICKAFDINPLTVTNVRKAFTERGLAESIIRKKPDREYQHRLDGNVEAHLIALACGEASEGYERWSLCLLQERFIKLEIIECVSHDTISTTLKKNERKPWLKGECSFPLKRMQRLSAIWKMF